jgi:hypothetical protein
VDDDQTSRSTEHEPDAEKTEKTKYTVLEVFGLKLEVGNPHMAELLTMDAGQAMAVDVSDIAAAAAGRRPVAEPDQLREVVAEVEQVVDDAVLAPPSAREEAESEQRRQLQRRVAEAGTQLGFAVRSGGVWESPTGITIVTRVVDSEMSLATASTFVDRLSVLRTPGDRSDTCVLFVAPTRKATDALTFAIRQRRLHDVMRTLAAEDLDTIVALQGQGRLDHTGALVLLSPVTAIDVGELLGLMQSE